MPIQRYLSVLAKKLLLNRFELLFLEYAFDVTKWNYELKAISEHVHAGFTPYIPLPESEGEEQEKLQAYMLYCGYYAKKSLNELPADNMFATFFYKTSPRFPKNYD